MQTLKGYGIKGVPRGVEPAVTVPLFYDFKPVAYDEPLLLVRANAPSSRVVIFGPVVFAAASTLHTSCTYSLTKWIAGPSSRRVQGSVECLELYCTYIVPATKYFEVCHFQVYAIEITNNWRCRTQFDLWIFVAPGARSWVGQSKASRSLAVSAVRATNSITSVGGEERPLALRPTSVSNATQ